MFKRDKKCYHIVAQQSPICVSIEMSLLATSLKGCISLSTVGIVVVILASVSSAGINISNFIYSFSYIYCCWGLYCSQYTMCLTSIYLHDYFTLHVCVCFYTSVCLYVTLQCFITSIAGYTSLINAVLQLWCSSEAGTA